MAARTRRRVMAIIDAEITRTCTSCGGTFGYEHLVKDKGSIDGVIAECHGCKNKRARRNELGFDLGWKTVNEAPDHRIPVRLRCQLARARRAGLDFEAVFADT